MEMETVDVGREGAWHNMLAAHWFSGCRRDWKAFCRVMLGKSGREVCQVWSLCSDSGAGVRDRTKAAPIDFSNTACHSQLIVLFLQQLTVRSYLTSHRIFFMLTRSHFTRCSGQAENLFYKKNNNNSSPFPLARALCINVSGFRAKQLSFCTSLPFPSRRKIRYARLSHSLTADSLKNSFHFPILLTRLYDCLRAKRVVPVYVDSVWVSRNANEERCLLPTKKIFSSRSLCSLSMGIKTK